MKTDKYVSVQYEVNLVYLISLVSLRQAQYIYVCAMFCHWWELKYCLKWQTEAGLLPRATLWAEYAKSSALPCKISADA